MHFSAITLNFGPSQKKKKYLKKYLTGKITWLFVLKVDKSMIKEQLQQQKVFKDLRKCEMQYQKKVLGTYIAGQVFQILLSLRLV